MTTESTEAVREIVVREIVELHDFFDGVFNGTRSDLERLSGVLAEGFSLVGPSGAVMDRAGTIAAIEAAQGARLGLRVSTEDHALLVEQGGVIVASYVEVHTTDDEQTRRLTTVVFTTDRSAPNGLRWERVHETWLP